MLVFTDGPEWGCELSFSIYGWAGINKITYRNVQIGRNGHQICIPVDVDRPGLPINTGRPE